MDVVGRISDGHLSCKRFRTSLLSSLTQHFMVVHTQVQSFRSNGLLYFFVF